MIDRKDPVKIRDFYDTASSMVNNITMRRSKGRRHPYPPCECKKGQKERKKKKEKNGGTKQPQQQQQQPTKVLKQSNLDGIIIESLDVEDFGDCFHPSRSKEFTRVAFQNCERQPQFCTSKKAADGSLAISAGKYNVLLYAKHGLYAPALLPKY